MYRQITIVALLVLTVAFCGCFGTGTNKYGSPPTFIVVSNDSEACKSMTIDCASYGNNNPDVLRVTPYSGVGGCGCAVIYKPINSTE